MKKVVIDTNVVISGLLFGEVPGEIVSLWHQKRILPYTSKAIIQEYLRVLSYPKFKLSSQEIEYILYHEILTFFELTETSAELPVVSKDSSDDIFIHCALAQSINTIISGDAHLLDLGKFQLINIFSPAEFLNLFHSE
jgi:putative PIN family toxin of toxin-antitoxin system